MQNDFEEFKANLFFTTLEEEDGKPTHNLKMRFSGYIDIGNYDHITDPINWGKVRGILYEKVIKTIEESVPLHRNYFPSDLD